MIALAWTPFYDVVVLAVVLLTGFAVDDFLSDRRSRRRTEMDAYRRRNAALRRARRRLR